MSHDMPTIAELQRQQTRVTLAKSQEDSLEESDPQAYALFDRLRRELFPMAIIEQMQLENIEPEAMTKLHPTEMHRVVLDARNRARTNSEELMELMAVVAGQTC